MDLNQVDVFIKVVEFGSFSSAAKILNLPVSTVSDRVSRLEATLACKLLYRTTRKLGLTSDGEVFYKEAKKGIEQLYNAKSSLSRNSGKPAGKLRVTTPIDLGEPIIATIIERLYILYPEIKIEIVMTNHRADLIKEGFDAAIRMGRTDDPSLSIKNIGGALWGAFASNGYLKLNGSPLSPLDLVKHRCIQFTPRGKDVWILNRKDSEIVVAMKNDVLINNINTITQLTKIGHGISLLPLYQIDLFSDDDLVRILPEWTSTIDSINIVHHKSKRIPLQLEIFINVASEVINKFVKKPYQ